MMMDTKQTVHSLTGSVKKKRENSIFVCEHIGRKTRKIYIKSSYPVLSELPIFFFLFVFCNILMQRHKLLPKNHRGGKEK
jgi:hypothetical protein